MSESEIKPALTAACVCGHSAVIHSQTIHRRTMEVTAIWGCAVCPCEKFRAALLPPSDSEP